MAAEQTSKRLTVIIPFLNEGEEVARTVESVRQYAGERVEIWVINDASAPTYDYEAQLKPYSVTYIHNPQRMGVAACRDWGVQQIQTPYFIFLDAHMRFYQEGWDRQIVDYLEQDDRRLLCCQTYALEKDENGEIIPITDRRTSYGAYIQFQGQDLLNPKWIFREDPQPEKDIADIPCVFGAAYATSKRYWNYLRGLEGLIRYGFDETYISLKIWLEGGRCQLIKHINTGHIYRIRSPYRIGPEELMYNRLWIATLLFPDNLREEVFSFCRQQNDVLYRQMQELLTQHEVLATELKAYYQKIFTIDFDRVKRFNTHLINI